jgi:hypothetical protein
MTNDIDIVAKIEEQHIVGLLESVAGSIMLIELTH